MIGICFDANIYLGAVLPNHPWKNFVNTMFVHLDNTTMEYQIFITSNLRKEVHNIITIKTDFILEQFRKITKKISMDKQPFSYDDLQELKQQINAEIKQLQKRRDEYHKLLLFMEEFLLGKISKNKRASKKEILLECLEFFRNFTIQLKNTAMNYEQKHNIQQIHLPKENNEKNQVNDIQKKLKLKNLADAKILALFIYYLKKNQLKGFFLTFDYRDFLICASKIESIFPEVGIFRPSYLQCLLL